MKESYYTSDDWHNVTELYGEGGREKNVVPVKFNDVNNFCRQVPPLARK
jgi:hypothetical protein